MFTFLSRFRYPASGIEIIVTILEEVCRVAKIRVRDVTGQAIILVFGLSLVPDVVVFSTSIVQHLAVSIKQSRRLRQKRVASG